MKSTYVKVASACVVATTLTFSAFSVASASTSNVEVTQRQITEAQAKEIALKQVPGTVVKVELDTENGVQVYEVDVKSQNQVFEVTIDASTGKVLKVEKED
ncbi:PepSY domain-containing protein [Bacillus sp. CGMCC 1.16541]|uniref:PepSY domain-containing protein n=1 Tax=Bacillus sp. CGMCC 1.16541 TaxID=2185143 RepID=UPI0013A5ACD4|nr:PepSY domain-containing protein [Bacillus sp. CGMCC 1.16541]